MVITNIQARDILRKYESDPIVLQGMQAIALALSEYGQPPGWTTPDNNWYAITFPAAPDGSCASPLEGLGAYSAGPGVCAFTYQTPEQGISHALNLWFPQQPDGTSGPEGLKFYTALKNGDTDTIAQMVMARTGWIPNRKVTTAQLGPLATWTFASDFYNAANIIAANVGDPKNYFNLPGSSVANIPVVPVPIDLVPVPLPGGQNPGGQPPPGVEPPPEKPPITKKDEGWSTGAKVLTGLLILGGGAALAKKVMK